MVSIQAVASAQVVKFGFVDNEHLAIYYLPLEFVYKKKDG